jgi:DNA polymerase III gamma/tau subunit
MKATELYRIHRPSAFKYVIGQEEAVRVLSEYVTQNRVPHAILFTGPSGCGKTTLARILQSKLECGDQDFVEINCADIRGIDGVREIRSRMQLHPIDGKSRIWLIDECHQLTKDAQNALLKMLEDTPDHVYFLLATTDPAKLLKTIVTRCTEIKVKELSRPHLITLLEYVCDKEGITLDEEVTDRLVEHSEGSARKALVLLQQIMDLSSPEERLAAIKSSDHKSKGIAIAKALCSPRCTWKELAPIVKSVDDDPETVRHIVLGYMNAIMLSGGALTERAFAIADIFQHNFYDSKKAGLTLACYAATKIR